MIFQYKFLTLNELIRVITTTNRKKYFVCGRVDFENKVIILYNGNLYKFIALFSWFPPNGDTTPDFEKFELIDHGQTIKLGDYEAASYHVIDMYD